MKTKRPASVTWLALGVLTITSINMIRLVLSISKREFLNTLLPSVPTIYFTVSGIIWSLIGAGLFWGLWRGKRWAAKYTRYAAITYAIYFWVDQLFIKVDPLRTTNNPFLVGLTLLLAITFWIVARPRARTYFGETNERRPKNSTTT